MELNQFIKNVIITFRADPGLVLLCKWRSRIFFLRNIKQPEKTFKKGSYTLKELLYISQPRPLGTRLVYFSVVFDALFSPWFPPWSSCFEACCLRLIDKLLKFSGFNSLLWSIQFKNICRSFYWKCSSAYVSDNNSLRFSYPDIFQHNTSYQPHGYLFCNII